MQPPRRRLGSGQTEKWSNCRDQCILVWLNWTCPVESHCPADVACAWQESVSLSPSLCNGISPSSHFHAHLFCIVRCFGVPPNRTACAFIFFLLQERHQALFFGLHFSRFFSRGARPFVFLVVPAEHSIGNRLL